MADAVSEPIFEDDEEIQDQTYCCDDTFTFGFFHDQNCEQNVLPTLSGITWTCCVVNPLCWCFSAVEIKTWEDAIRFKFGRLISNYDGTRKVDIYDEGLHIRNCCMYDEQIVDMREKTMDIPAKEMITRDYVSLNLDPVVFYRVVDPVKAIVNVENYHYACQSIAQSFIRAEVGAMNFMQPEDEKGEDRIPSLFQPRGQINEDSKNELGERVQKHLMKATAPWGIEITKVKIVNIILPGNMQRAMASEVEMRQAADALLERADGEQTVAENYLEAASNFENPIALQLRYLRTISKISKSNNQNETYIFPVPENLYPHAFPDIQ